MKSFLVAGACGLALAGAAVAKPNGWYVGAAGGVNWVEDTVATRTIGAGAPAFYGNLEFDQGWVALANVGYRWPSNWRLELEGGYRSNDGNFKAPPFGSCTAVIGAGAACTDAQLTEWTLMGNVFYDFPLTPKLTFSVGAGVGGDMIDFDQIVLAPNWDDDTVFAGQLIAQLGFMVTPQLELYADYHYLALQKPEFSRATPTVETLDFEVDKHSLLIGLRYDLQRDEVAAPPAPPAPPPPPPPVKQFIVFFGFNKYNLTADAQAVVAEAASTARSVGAASIIVVGHTDTVGSNAYNQRLSEKRAGAVKDELVRLGISAGMISASGRGETELMVQTGDNVKEPQNRRATIDLK